MLGSIPQTQGTKRITQELQSVDVPPKNVTYDFTIKPITFRPCIPFSLTLDYWKIEFILMTL